MCSCSRLGARLARVAIPQLPTALMGTKDIQNMLNIASILCCAGLLWCNCCENFSLGEVWADFSWVVLMHGLVLALRPAGANMMFYALLFL